MKSRIPLFSIIGFFVLGLIISTFYDYEINSVLFMGDSLFAISISAISGLYGYPFLSIFAGALIVVTTKVKVTQAFKLLAISLSFVIISFSIFFTGRSIISHNGFNLKGDGYWWMAMSITTVFNLLLATIGGIAGYKKANKYLFYFLFVFIACSFAGAVFTASIKGIVYRPRFRLLKEQLPGIHYCRWWESQENYNYYISQGVNSDEFNSFPSGHSTYTIFATLSGAYLYVLFPKLKKLSYPLFFFGFAWNLLNNYARIRCGAHFMSDVSVGALTVLFFYIFAQEFYLRYYLPRQSVYNPPLKN